MNDKDLKYLLDCIERNNHYIVCAYLKHILSEGKKKYFEAVRQLKAGNPVLVNAYLNDEETNRFFIKNELPIPSKRQKEKVA